MRFGLYAINYATCADPGVLARVARHAEDAGFDSVWAGEHIVLPSPQPPDYAIAPEIPFLDPIVALTLAATATSSIMLATGILEVPLHQPVLLAKQLASLDRVSQGRLAVGLGVGYLGAEFHALGVPLEDRGARFDEYVGAMRALWTMEVPEYHGRYVDVVGVDAHPRPVQPGGPPLYMGGNSGLARRRAVTSMRGWCAADFDLDATRAARAAIDRDVELLGRPADLGPFDFPGISPRNRLDRSEVEAYAELGVDRLVVLPGLDQPVERRYHGVPVDDVLRTIDHHAALLA